MPYSQVDDIDILKNEILNLTTVQFKNDNNSNRVPKELKSLIKKLMVKVPTKRPKAREILNLYGGYKDGIGIKITTSVDSLSKDSSNPSSASSSTKNLDESPTITKKDIEKNNNRNKNYDNNYLTPLQNTNIPKNKHKDKENENEKENKESKENLEQVEIDESKDKEKEWLDKELVDEPLSFQAEKRIVPFNHNRSKSLPQTRNNQVKYVTFHNKNINNTIKDEEPETSISEKRLVSFQNFEYPEHSSTSQSYPPIKNTNKDYGSSTENHKPNKDKWINESDYTKEIIRKTSREILNNPKEKKKFIDSIRLLVSDSLSLHNLQDILIILKKNLIIKELITNFQNWFLEIIDNPQKLQHHQKKKFSKRKTNHPRHTYKNSKIYFLRNPHSKIRTIPNKKIIKMEKKDLQIKEKQIVQFKSHHPIQKNNNFMKLNKILHQNYAIINLFLFLLKVINVVYYN